MAGKHATFCIIFIALISDCSIAGKLPFEALQESEKTDDQEKEMVFSSEPTSTMRDTNLGYVPIVNPTIPGTIPIINPATPPPPALREPVTTTPMPSGGAWCIVNPTASQIALQVALDYACGYGGADCSAIQPNAACYDPNTLRDHASYAFNDYYQKNPISTSCVFGGTAQLSYTDPSHGNCRYVLSTSTPTTPTMTPTIPTTTPAVTPPSITSPINPYTPGVGTGDGTEPTGYDYGNEPTGTSSSAKAVSYNLLLLITINCILLSVATANHF